MTQLVVVNGMTAHRANVIAARTGSAAMSVVKAQMIDLLKAKLQSGVAHFIYMKKDGTIREAWGTCAGNLMRATQNGRGLSGDAVNTVKYWDTMSGGYLECDGRIVKVDSLDAVKRFIAEITEQE